MSHKRIPSGSKWEDIVGYSRVVKAGNLIEVAGTTSSDGENVIGKGDYYLQSKYIFEKIEKYLSEAGATLKDVIRTRIYVCDIQQWEAVGKAHAEFFGQIKPVSTMVEVSKLVHPDILVEIEVTAVADEG